MPFGSTNTLATFQDLMNDILRPYLRRFVLVFFDDILIYINSWLDQLRHVRTVLRLLQQHKLFLKRSKCLFGRTFVGYLGHIISGDGVVMDTQKVQRCATSLRYARYERCTDSWDFPGITESSSMGFAPSPSPSHTCLRKKCSGGQMRQQGPSTLCRMPSH